MSRIVTVFFSILITLQASMVLAAPKADLWERWQKHDPESTIQVDHSIWQGILDSYLSQPPLTATRFDYAAVNEKDSMALKGYLKQLSAISVSNLSRPEQKAYWINLYNALTVATILDHYPVKTIREINISPGWFTSGPWGAKQIRIEGEEISLDDIEHRILRPIWQDPRIHYAVNCASLGCPDLSKQVFIADHLDQQLDQAAEAFIQNGRGVMLKGKGLVVSSIYHWFRSDFGSKDEDVIRHLHRYASPELKQQLQRVSKITDHEYDWRLNAPDPAQ